MTSQERQDSQLFSRVERSSVYLTVKLGADVFQGPVIPKGPPLGVNAHPPLVAFYQVNVPQLLHVASISASALERERRDQKL